MASNSKENTPTTVTSSQQAPLTKSQKKRMKQKANKAAKREAEKRAQQQPTGSSSLQTLDEAKNTANVASLNPHLKLRHDLTQKGFHRDEIESALEEMWDLGLEYDSFDAALVYLEGKSAQKEADRAAAAAAVAAAELIDTVAEVVETTTTTAASPPAGGYDDVAVASIEEPQEPIEDDTGSMEGSVPSTESPKSKSTGSGKGDTGAQGGAAEEPTGPMDLATKLDVVAHFENLHDAVFALAEWVVKAAKSNELLELCAVNKTSGTASLHVVIRRCILECPEDPDYNLLLPSLRSLVVGIARAIPCNFNDRDSKKNVADALLKSITTARAAISESQKAFPSADLYNSIANSVAEFVTTVVSSALSASISDADSNGKDHLSGEEELGLVTIQKIEDEINAMLTQLPSRGTGVVELMTRRDCRKIAAEKSSYMTKILVDAAIGERDSHTNNTTSESDMASTVNVRLSNDEAKLELTSSLLAEYMPIVQESRATYENTQIQLKTAQSERSVLQSEITTDLLACQADRVRIETRKEELRKEMELLDLESDAVLAREFELNTKLEKLNDDPNAEVSGLQAKQDQLVGLVKVDDTVKRVVDDLAEFETCLVTLQMSKNNEHAAAKKLNYDKKRNEIVSYVDYGMKMSSFFVQMRNYFMAEVDIIDFLRGRIASLRIDMEGLQREVAECTALGMTTNVSQMTQSLGEISRNISDDEAVVDALRGEAEKMRDVFIQQTEAYLALGKEPTSSDRSILSEIGLLLSRINLDCAGNVLLLPKPTVTNSTNLMSAQNGSSSVMPSHDYQKPQQPQPTILPQQAQAPLMPPPAVTEAPVVSEPPAPKPVPVAMPKLSWAVPSRVATKKTEVKSLLDIQREEMSAKKATAS